MEYRDWRPRQHCFLMSDSKHPAYRCSVRRRRRRCRWTWLFRQEDVYMNVLNKLQSAWALDHTWRLPT